jgi:PhzF family phenazine biosynthesis protein
MKLYDVFSEGPGGGKRFAIVQDYAVPISLMPEIAQTSQASLTGFIMGFDPNLIEVRFFNSIGKEKLESDSGALVVAYVFGSSCTVVMPDSELEVTLEDGACWTAQGDHHILPLRGDENAWLEALGISSADLEPGLTLLCAGTLEKHNLIVPVLPRALDTIEPNFEALAQLLKTHEINGVIPAAFVSKRANLDFRFFAPHKGLIEDNAGSFSLASLCGYQAAHTPSGVYDLTAAQGYALGKPSSLRAQFIARDGMALAVRIGGVVVEVT